MLLLLLLFAPMIMGRRVSEPPLDLSLLAKQSVPVESDVAPSDVDHDGDVLAGVPPTSSRRGTRSNHNGQSTKDDPHVVPPKPRPGTLVKPLRDLYTSAGTMIVPFQPQVGMAFIENAEACAIALENAARENVNIRKALLALIETSVWGNLIAAHLPILMVMAVAFVPQVRAGMARVQFDIPTVSDDGTANPVSNG